MQKSTKYFDDNRSQHYLVFQPISKSCCYFRNTGKIYSWTSKAMLKESIKKSPKADNRFGP